MCVCVRERGGETLVLGFMHAWMDRWMDGGVECRYFCIHDSEGEGEGEGMMPDFVGWG